MEMLVDAGADVVELGVPFSDPLADGPPLQASSTTALKNGMTSDTLFEQLKDIRKTVSIPLIIMGYFNPVLQYGVEKFCKKCQDTGIDGLILPDLPLSVYQSEYEPIFKKFTFELNKNHSLIKLSIPVKYLESSSSIQIIHICFFGNFPGV